MTDKRFYMEDPDGNIIPMGLDSQTNTWVPHGYNRILLPLDKDPPYDWNNLDADDTVKQYRGYWGWGKYTPQARKIRKAVGR